MGLETIPVEVDTRTRLSYRKIHQGSDTEKTSEIDINRWDYNPGELGVCVNIHKIF